MRNGLAVLALLCCSGCTAFTASSVGGDEMVMVAGTPEAIRAYNDGYNGLVTNIRGNPDQKSAYWQNRERETEVRGLRFRVKGAQK